MKEVLNYSKHIIDDLKDENQRLRGAFNGEVGSLANAVAENEVLIEANLRLKKQVEELTEALEEITKYDRDKSYAWYKIAREALGENNES